MAQTFDQYLAESGRQSELDQLRKSGQYDVAKSKYESSGSFGSPSQPTINFQDTVKQAIEMQKQATAPAVQSLQSSLPEISQSFQQQREQTTAQIKPLKERYKNLLDEVTGKAKASEEAQTRITSGELGKRGIVGSSTLAQQEIQNAVEPIRSGARTAIKDVGLAQEQGLMQLQNILSGLTTQETEQKRAVQNAIAQLKSGSGQAGIQQALALLQQQQAQSNQNKSLDLQQAQQDLAQKVFEKIQLPESAANLANIQSTIANRGSGSGMDLNSFLSLFGVGPQQPQQSYSFGSNVIDLLKEGNVDQALELALNP